MNELIVTSIDYRPRGDWMMQARETYLAGYAVNTRRTYESRLNSFAEWSSRQNTSVPLTLLKTYVTYLRDERKLQARTIQGHMNTIKGMLKTAAALEPESAELAKLIVQMSLVKLPKAIGQIMGQRLSEAETQRLIEAPGIETTAGLRNTCMLALLSVLGLRRNELCILRWGHITHMEGLPVISNLTSKHGRTRTMKLTPELYELLMRWGRLSKRDIADPTVKVFCPVTRDNFVLHNRPGLTPHAIYKMVLQSCERAGITIVRPHDLRRTAALLARKGGATIEQVQNLLGHESPQTTSHYIGEGFDLHNNAVDKSPIKLPKAA